MLYSNVRLCAYIMVCLKITSNLIVLKTPNILHEFHFTGYGDMAVSNSIGSNIFDILLCLGLPWLLQTSVVEVNSVIYINSASLTFVSLTLLATVVFLFSSMLLNGWKLNKKFGVLCLIVYAIVITIACLFEMNVFGEINLPPCPRTRT